LFIVLHIDVTP